EDYDPDYWEGGNWTDCPIVQNRSFDSMDGNLCCSSLFEFEFLPVGLRFQTREQIKTEMRAAFEEEMKVFLNELEQAAISSGYINVGRKNNDTHFQWLAYYQVKKLSYNEIRETYAPHVGNKAVEKAIKETAGLVGFTLRQ